jgi:hypothetical protein
MLDIDLREFTFFRRWVNIVDASLLVLYDAVLDVVGDTHQKGESMRRLLLLTSVSFWVASLVLVPAALAFGQTATPTPTAPGLPGTGGAGGVALVAAALLLGVGILSYAIFRNRS